MKRIAGILIAILAVILMTGCSRIATGPAEQGLHYKAGPMSATKFANCVGPSTRNWDGPADKHYTYPYGQRTFSFTGRDGSETQPIAVTDSGGQHLDIPGYITFTLTNDCKLLQQFHERIGLKYKAYDNGDGWNAFLNDYLETPLISAMNKAAQDAPSWKAIYSDTATQAQFEADVKESLPGLVTTALGGDYITINGVQISKPGIDTKLSDSIQEKNIAQQENAAQKAKNAKIRTQYDTLNDCLKTGLSESSCTLIFLEQSGANIPFLPVPQGGAVNFNSTTP